MSNKFNLSSLSKIYDNHPRSWICISGNNLGKTVSLLESDIERLNKITREELSRKISSKFNCSHSVIKRILYDKKRRYYPIPVILEMLKLCKSNKNYMISIENGAELLKVNSASSKPVKAVKFLTPDLAKMIGAFMADGSLSYQIIIASKNNENLGKVRSLLQQIDIKPSESYSKSRNEYFLSFNPNYDNFSTVENLLSSLTKEFQVQTHTNIELADEYKSSVEAFNKWIKNSFDIEPSKFEQRDNYWRTIFSNKILGRYLICFFGVKSGYKTDIAFEPHIIKSSTDNIRKSFALGVLTFDGSCTISGNITLATKSKRLAVSIGDILRKIHVKFGNGINRDCYTILVYKNNNLKKISSLFEKGTVKWYRLQESREILNDKNFVTRYKKFSNSKITFPNLLNLLKNIKMCDINFLMNCFNCSRYTVTCYLKILRNNNIIRLSSKPLNFNLEFVDIGTTVYLKKNFHNKIFNTILKRFTKYSDFCNFIQIGTKTISAWKLRKNRIPISVVKIICDSLKIDYLEINNNIEETDRQIVEVIQ